MKSIAIIGGGNLGTAIAGGLLSGNFILPAKLTVTRRNPALLQAIVNQGVHVHADNGKAVAESDVVILAVKPFQAKEVLEDIKAVIKPGQLLISVVTGVSINDLRSATGDAPTIVRAMPNTAIAIRESMTCLCSERITNEEKHYVESIFINLGKTVFIEEKLMNAATVLGACGTAFAMRYIRANIQGGIEIGFDAKTAALIAAQTVKGAAELLLITDTHPEIEIDKVTTPKGCTIAGLNEMEHQGFTSSLIKGITASYDRIA